MEAPAPAAAAERAGRLVVVVAEPAEFAEGGSAVPALLPDRVRVLLTGNPRLINTLCVLPPPPVLLLLLFPAPAAIVAVPAPDSGGTETLDDVLREIPEVAVAAEGGRRGGAALGSRELEGLRRVGTRMISCVSNVLASTKWTSEVC